MLFIVLCGLDFGYVIYFLLWFSGEMLFSLIGFCQCSWWELMLVGCEILVLGSRFNQIWVDYKGRFW